MNLINIDDKTIIAFSNILKYFEKFTTGGINHTEEKFLIQMLDKSIQFYFYLVDELTIDSIERITINKNILGSNKRIKNISQLKYPPAERVTRYGRCNKPKQSVFYGTFTWMTALDELRPEYGDLISRTKWVNRNSTPITCCPVFLNQPEGDYINPRTLDYANKFYREVDRVFPNNAASLVIDLFQFISDAYARRIDSSNDKDYLFSAYFADKIFNEFEGGTIDAIYYPSVKERLSFENIAIKPSAFDKIFQLDEVRESIIVNVPNRRVTGYMMEGMYECSSFNHETGEIIWAEASERFDPTTIEQIIENFNIDFD